MTFEDRIKKLLSEKVATPERATEEETTDQANSPAAPTVPTKPATEPKTKPDPARPKEPRPHRDPFRVPRPAVDPQPQNAMMVVFMEGYEEEAHPNVQKFWRDLPREQHQLSKHPVFAVYGNDLSKAGYEHTAGRVAKIHGNDPARAFQQIVALEHRHKDALQELAIKVVAGLWGFPAEQLRAMLSMQVDVNQSAEVFRAEEEESQDDLTKEINKRLTLNTLSHGSSVHSMMTLHHLVDKEIKTIDPRLIELYDQISAGSHHQYWLWDVAAMAEQLAGMSVGSAKVEFQDVGDEHVPIVVAKAVCFPVLVQELCKGIMNLLSMHGLRDKDEKTTKSILRQADDIRHEPWLIQVGPELWRRFIRVVNSIKGISHASVIAALASKDPDEVHNIIISILDNKPEAVEMIKALVADDEDEGVGPEADEGEDVQE